MDIKKLLGIVKKRKVEEKVENEDLENPGIGFEDFENEMIELENEYYNLTGESPYKGYENQSLFRESAMNFLKRHSD